VAAYRVTPRPQPRVTPRRRRFCATGAAAFGLLALALSPSATGAEDAVPIGAAAALPPGLAAPGPTLPPPAPQPASPPQLPGNPELLALLYGADVPVVAGEPLRHPGLVRQFYAEHGNEPFWGDHAEAARALLGAVFRAEDQGLDPALFHAAALSRGGLPPAPVARDVLVTDAVLSYADALAEGAVPPAERPATEALHPMPIDVVAAVDQAIAAPDPARNIAALAPSSPEYEALRRAYAYYAYSSALAARTPVAPGDTPAANYENGGSGPYPPYDQYSDSGGSPPYSGYADGNRYQGYAQGYSGYSSVDPWLAARRARQLAVALERLRWLPRNPPPERIMVNTATQELYYFADDHPVFTTRVVVGEPTWQTPEFHATIGDVLFNPPWRVPPDIMRKEILPKLARDRGYLARHHMRWIGPMQVEQVAGPYSALGRLKFEMSDPYEVYLHDTPEKHLFRLANRMKSHGCVRIRYPQELAALLLHESPLAVERGIAEGRTHAQALPQPVDVYITYQTVSLGPSGAIIYHADPYHRDSEIWQLLNPPGGSPVAQDDGIDARKG
jgi:murein L,D-transpeptidase YcbB/YkuD